MKKILAIRNDRFGEFLLNIPVFRAIKETFPQDQLHVVVSPAVEELARAVSFIDRVLVRPFGRLPWWEELAFIARIRHEKYAMALVLNPSREVHHVVFWAGIPVRAGYARKHHFLLTRTIKDQKHVGLRHEVEHNLELAGLLGAVTENKTLALNIPPDTKEAVIKKFEVDPREMVMAVHPWTSDPIKQWPLARFGELVEGLSADFPGRILIIGKPEDWHADIVFSGKNVLDLRGQTTLMEAAALLGYCRCLVSCDSGPVHLAACVGTPVVALFRNDMPGKNPERWGPWGQGHRVIQQAGMDKISVDEVWGVVNQIMGRA
ncbi:MAG: glycosyltransferase family 9 protein [Candidatus Omnitrophota bacterium]